MTFPCFQLLYMTFTIDKMDRHGLINTACRERLPKNIKVMQYWLQKDYPKDGAFKRCIFAKRLRTVFSSIIFQNVVSHAN